MTEVPADAAELAATIGRTCQARSMTVGTAESLTGGAIASALSAAPAASEWFAGSIVAYSTRVKHELLGVSAKSVVSETAARDMAIGARGLLRADVVVSVTGAGGPQGQDGRDAGTVCFAVATDSGVHTETLHLDGSPQDVVRWCVRRALTLLRERV